MPSADKMNLHALYADHRRELTAFARQRVGESEAADVVQDTYLRMMQYAGQVSLENPRAYLYRIAANVATDRGIAQKACDARLEQDIELDTLSAVAPSVEATVDARKRIDRCIAALDELPAAYRHAFLLHRIDGLTQGEIASALEIPRRSVERYIAKALEHCLKRAGSERD